MISNRSKATSAAVGLALACVLLPMTGGASAAASKATGDTVAQTSSAAVCDYFYGDRPTISYGSSGPAVKQAQCELNGVINAGLAIDGTFGTATESTTKKFQAKYGLVKDGIIGPKTWARLSDVFHHHALC